MSKIFSVASWNVRHFKGKQSRVDRIVDFLTPKDPDIIAIYEVTGKAVFGAMTEAFPTHTFHITEGRQSQEILIGVRGGFSAFFTQKVEFKGGNPMLRPGALLSIKAQGKTYTLLFLHTKSMQDPKGFGLRDFMLEKAIKLRKVLKKQLPSNIEPNYLFLGDLNTMGMNYKYSDYDIPQVAELAKLDKFCKANKLRRLPKTHEKTYGKFSTQTPLISNLDHVVASEHLKFTGQSGNSDVEVSGWVDKSTVTTKKRWTEKYSDHCLLYFEVTN